LKQEASLQTLSEYCRPLVEVQSAQCTNQNCPCYNCVYNKRANYWQDCGTINSWGLFPAGTPITVYDMYNPSQCTACGGSSGRFTGRIPTMTQWGFVYYGDLTNCVLQSTEFSEIYPLEIITPNPPPLLKEAIDNLKLNDNNNINNNNKLNTTITDCPVAGVTYKITDNTYLRDSDLFDCGLMQPGQDVFTVSFADSSCFWCHGTARGSVCDDIAHQCTGCVGLCECSKLG